MLTVNIGWLTVFVRGVGGVSSDGGVMKIWIARGSLPDLCQNGRMDVDGSHSVLH